MHVGWPRRVDARFFLGPVAATYALLAMATPLSWDFITNFVEPIETQAETILARGLYAPWQLCMKYYYALLLSLGLAPVQRPAEVIGMWYFQSGLQAYLLVLVLKLPIIAITFGCGLQPCADKLTEPRPAYSCSRDLRFNPPRRKRQPDTEFRAAAPRHFQRCTGRTLDYRFTPPILYEKKKKYCAIPLLPEGSSFLAVIFMMRKVLTPRPHYSEEESNMSGWAIWITGLPGSGKSTIARIVARRLLQQHIGNQLLSVEMLRKVLTPRPEYSEEERDMVYGALVFVAELLARNNVKVVIDATANRRRYRDAARLRIRRFAEVYLECPLQLCMRREMRRKKRFGAPSRIYVKAKTGASKTVPGLGVPYEEPLSPDIILDTSKLRPNECAERIVKLIRTKFRSAR